MNLPNQITGTFNRPITLGTGSLKVYKDGSLFLTFTQDDIIVVSNVFTINITNLFPDNGSYFIVFDTGLFKSGAEIYQGITSPTQWTFTIATGEYDNTEYSNEYLLN